MWFINNKIYTPPDAEKALGLTVFSSVPLVENEQTNDEKKASDKKAEGGKK